MKFFNLIFAITTAMTLSLVGCGEDVDPTPEPGPNPPAPSELTFDVEITDVTKARVFFDVTPSSSDAEYMTMVYDAAFVDSFSKDEYLVGAIYEDITEFANTKGLTLKEYLTENAERGVITDGVASGLAVSTDYCLVVFGVDVESIVFDVDGEDNNYALTSAISRNHFTTQDAPVSDATFDVTAIVDMNTVKFEVVPSDKQIYWHLMTMPQESIDYYLSDQGGMTLQSFYMRYAQQEIDQLLGLGYSPDEVIKAIFLQGDLTLNAKGLNAYTEYGYLIAGFVIDEDGTYLATTISEGTYTTYEPRYTGLTFDVTVSEIETTRAAIKIVPSNDTDTYFSLIAPYDGKSTADELMELNLKQWGNFMFAMGSYTGAHDYSGKNGTKKFRLDSDGTEYYILNFGYDGGVTSEPNLVTFKTKEGLEPDEAEFTMEAKNVTTHGADVVVTCNDESVQYIVGVVKPSEFDEKAIVDELNAQFPEWLAESAAFDPATTYAQLFSGYYWRGNQTLAVSGLAANTEVMGYIITLDDKTGRVSTVHTFEKLFSTTAEGNINPTLSNEGIFSGDEENGQIWTDKDGNPQAIGYAIAVIKIENYSGAKSLYFTSIDQDYTYEASYPDTYLMSNLGWSDNSGGTPYTEAPYIFTLLSWNKDYSFFAYAVDENGGTGKVGRLAVKPLAKDKQPIAKLIELYEEANSSASAYVPGSIVVENSVIRTNAVITSKEAPEFVKESVVYDAKPSLQPELLQFGYVKRHTLRD